MQALRPGLAGQAVDRGTGVSAQVLAAEVSAPRDQVVRTDVVDRPVDVRAAMSRPSESARTFDVGVGSPRLRFDVAGDMDDEVRTTERTFLLTDITGSTRLYDQLGDFQAFAQVRHHLRALQQTITQANGTVVKTLGDGVLAAFANPTDALKAAVTISEASRHGDAAGDLQLKMGLHSGYCIAVDSGEHTDYFGQTVNIAARMQEIAQGSEICLTESLLNTPDARDVVSKAGFHVQESSVALRGVEDPIHMYRLSPAG